MRISGLYKGVSVVETLMYNSEDPAKSYENLNFLVLSFCVYLLENYPTQFKFLSHSESAELVFCSEDLSFLCFKNPNKIFSSERKESIFTIFFWMLWVIQSISTTETPLIAHFFSSQLMTMLHGNSLYEVVSKQMLLNQLAE